MRLCDGHWMNLRRAIARRGLSKFLSHDGSDVADRIRGALRGLPAEVTYEPLAFACMAIYRNAVERFGEGVLRPDEGGVEPCPLCYGVAHCECGRGADCGVNLWVEYAAEGQLIEARQLGLVKDAPEARPS